MKNQVIEEEESSLVEKRRFELKSLHIRSCRWIILLVGLILSQVGANVVECSSPWPMFQHDKYHTGTY